MNAVLERLRAELAGRYAVEQELGHGGMAVVYLAKDLKHDRRVAIKVLRQDVGGASAERFRRCIGLGNEDQQAPSPARYPLNSLHAKEETDRRRRSGTGEAGGG